MGHASAGITLRAVGPWRSEWDRKAANVLLPLVAIFMGIGGLAGPDLDTPMPPVLLALLIGIGVGRLVWIAAFGFGPRREPPSD